VNCLHANHLNHDIPLLFMTQHASKLGWFINPVKNFMEKGLGLFLPKLLLLGYHKIYILVGLCHYSNLYLFWASSALTV